MNGLRHLQKGLRRRATGWLALGVCIVAVFVTEAVPADHQATGRDHRMELTSPAFAPGAPIPRKYTGEGEDVSPPLVWSDPPEGTRELALICDDPDAPMPTPWVHWVAYKISPERRSLAEGAQDGFRQGRNDFGRRSYGGPMPPRRHGVHHYHFKLYALDIELPNEELTKAELLERIEGHVLAEAELVGTYERK